MRKILLTVLVAAVASPLLAQDDPLSQTARQAWNRTKNLVLAAAQQMPEEHYAFKPAAESQSFADLVAHTANAAMGACTSTTGQRRTASARSSSSKADLVAALEKAGAECTKVYRGLTDAKATQMIEGRRGGRPLLGVLYQNTIHIEHEYAQMAVHMRLKGLVPPSSAPREGGAQRRRAQGARPAN